MIPDYFKIKKIETTRHEKQKENFDSRHKAHNLSMLKKQGDMVGIPDHNWESCIRSCSKILHCVNITQNS